MLGTINNNSKKATSSVNEIKDYSPPKKEPKIFEEEIKKKIPKKIKKKPIKEKILELNNESVEEDPLILEELHTEKVVHKKALEKNQLQ